MKPINIPVVPAGAHHEENPELAFMAMPSGMEVFRMPEVPASGDTVRLSEARSLVARFTEALATYRSADFMPPRLELSRLEEATRVILNQVLGQGEVSAVISGPESIRIQETAFAGVWRVQHLAADASVSRDYLEGGAIPDAVRRHAGHGAATAFAVPTPPEGVMNSPAVLREILERSRECPPGNPAHVVNLTLLPLTPPDLAYLGDALGKGPVTLLSRGFGNCRITSTALHQVWWVQYFNSVETPILNTLEVAQVPEVAMAAPEDLADSVERLRELVQWMEQE